MVDKEPFKQFQSWFEEKKNIGGMMETNAMTLATAHKDGCPSVRRDLIKGFDKGI